MNGSSALRVAAVIVAYHPQAQTLHALLQALDGQVEWIWLVDNTPVEDLGCAALLASLAESWPRLQVQRLGQNLGIAAAFNRGLEHAMAAGASHVLLSDQDSLPNGDMVDALLAAEARLMARGVRPGALGPIFRNAVDARPFRFQVLAWGGWRYRYTYPTAETPELRVASLISSGCLIPADVLRAVGAMREDLFIDYVDIEWCHRAAARGYPSYACLAAVLEHRMGDRALPVWLLGWRQIAEYGPTRLYYQFRNSAYLIRCGAMAPAFRLVQPWFWLGKLYAYAVFSSRRLSSLKMMGQGWWHGLRGRLGVFRGQR